MYTVCVCVCVYIYTHNFHIQKKKIYVGHKLTPIHGGQGETKKEAVTTDL